MSVAQLPSKKVPADAARQAYIALMTLTELEKALPASVDRTSAARLNEVLEEIRTILSADPAFVRSISHLKPLEYHYQAPEFRQGEFIPASHNAAELGRQARFLLAELKGKLRAFLAVHLPAKEKKRIGFEP